MNNIAQSNLDGELERLGGVRKTHEPDKSGREVREAREDAGGVSERVVQKKEQKKRKKWPIVVVILAILAVVGGGVAWWMLQDRGEQVGESDSEEFEDVAEELDIDSELVQRLYGYFQNAGWVEDNRWHVYIGGINGDDEAARKIKLHFTKDVSDAVKCKGEYYYEEDKEGDPDYLVQECYAGEDLRQKYEEIFGEKLTLVAGDEIDFGEYEFDDKSGRTYICGWRYDVDNDEFRGVGIACGGGWPARAERELEKAVRYGDRIELYERVLLRYEGALYHVGSSVKDFYGEEVMRDDDLDAESVKDALDKEGDEFRWTFVKNAEGNYVFEKIEKVE